MGCLDRFIETTVSTDQVQALTGDVVDVVRHAANLLGGFGMKLLASEVVITGLIVPPLWVVEEEEIRFQLDPIGNLLVKMAMSR